MLSDERDRSRLREGVRALVEMARGDAVAAISDGPVDRANTNLTAIMAGELMAERLGRG
jgi:hypothetical protein